MCLLTSRRQGWITAKDIVCYKVLCEKNGDYFTPYMYRRVNENVISGKYPLHDDTASDIYPLHNVFSEKNSDRFLTGAGFIHSFKGFRSAKQLCYDLSLRHSNNYIVYKCIIPAGTRYYKGKDEYLGVHAYAAEKIKFVEEVYRINYEERIKT